jgi:cell wall-associated NlpC family hydrolase
MMSLVAVGSAACATSGTPVPRPFPGAPAAPVASAPDGATVETSPDSPAEPDHVPVRPVDGRALAEFALGFRGVPYRPGGSDPSGFDCSGLVQYVFAQYGISIPRVVEQQFEIGAEIKPRDIKPGDLIFFDTKKHWGSSAASHVAIAIGRDSFVHAPNSTGVVRVETLGSSYWGARYVGARRITNSASAD